MKLDPDDHGTTYRRVEERLDPLMLFLSLIFLPLLLGPVLTDMSSAALRAFQFASAAIWLLFAIEYATLLYLAPDRREMVRTHKVDLIIVVLPFLRPLAFLRILRLTTAASGLERAVQTMKRIGGRPGLRTYLFLATATIFIGAGLTLAFEHKQRGTNRRIWTHARRDRGSRAAHRLNRCGICGGR